MRKKRFVLTSILISSVLLGISLLLFFVATIIIPKDPIYPYWLDKSEYQINLKETGWILGKVRPVYLLHYSKDGAYYFVGGIRDNRGKVKLLNIFVGEKIGNSRMQLPKIFNKETGEYINYSEYKDLIRNFKFGSQMEISFISFGKVTDTETMNEYCKYYTRTCTVVQSTQDLMKSLEIFADTGAVTGNNFYIPVYEFLL